MFHRLIHSDWSVAPRKRWCAEAVRMTDGWHVTTPRRVGATDTFVDHAFTGTVPVLLGFDFPIGMPEAYGRQTKLSGFRAALPLFGESEWARFFDVAAQPEEISLHRPFYPRDARKGVTRAELVAALGVEHFNELHRACERNTGGADACALFWTLGGNQVGRGALTGWSDVIRPALAQGAKLWPYDGELTTLARTGVTLAETYPALDPRALGVPFARGESKRNSADRRSKAANLLKWAERHHVTLDADAETALQSGFGPSSAGEDAFDPLLGLLLMIEIVDGRRPPHGADYTACDWEGWILGR